MRLYLIRHPQPVVPPGLCYGQTDLLPRAPWDAELKQVRSRLPPALTIHSSPLQRCREFAAALATDVHIDERLSELDFGAWEMLPWAEVPRSELDGWAADPIGYAGDGGESVAMMQVRVASALADLPVQDCAWVTHAGVMKLVLAQLLGLAQAEWLEMKFAYASVSCLEINPDGAKLMWRSDVDDALSL
ncbi:MAG TPA: histidine phosphatase family protein [Rhodocyclaceae bacterium]|jgi:alpha-ribazole phosphatase|nr:histidine phosphatase family protein [Rhodocyclaceae bacterium]